MTKAILFDGTQCVGCLECEAACAKENGLAYDEEVGKIKKTSEKKLTYVAVRNTGEEKYMRRLCMHCDDPACVSVCPVKALEKTKEGPVVYDASKCMGCRYCMVACPYGIPKYEWSKAIPTIKKCIMCSERVKAGKQTACAEACPTGATKFGDRALLIIEAHQRINENPLQYIDHVYGEHEIGGTNVLMLSSVRFEEFGLPTTLGTRALPELTESVLSHVPDVVTLGSAVLGGVYWITHRREVVALTEKNEEKGEE